MSSCRFARAALTLSYTLASLATVAVAAPVTVVDHNGVELPGSSVWINGQVYATGSDAPVPDGTYTVYVSPGFAGRSNRDGLSRAEVVTLPADPLRFTWATRSVTLDVRRNAADPATRLVGSQVRIISAPFAAGDNVSNVPSVWSSQAYAYGPGLPVPQTLTLPVTTGYANMSGNYAHEGYDVTVLPAVAPGHIGSLARNEGQGNGQPAVHVGPTTSELVFEWRTRQVTVDVRTDANDPSTRLTGSQVRIIGAPFAAQDNVEGTPSVWSSQNYPYGPGVPVPFTIELPVTTGYPFVAGSFADEGYDITVQPAIAPGQIGALSRNEGQGIGQAPRVVDFTTTAWNIEWKTRAVTLDVRSDATDPATRIAGSLVRILGAPWAASDNVNGVPNVFSSQAYPYGPAPAVPTTVTLPITRGYPSLAGAYATFGYDMSVEPAFFGSSPGAGSVLMRQEGIDAATPRHVEATTSELVFEWKTAAVRVDVRTDANDPTTSIAGSAVQFGAYQYGPVLIANRDGVSSAFTAQSYPHGFPLEVPFQLTLPVTTGYPYLAGSAASFGWDSYVIPGLCGRVQARAPGGTRLSRAEGIDVATPPARHVTPTTTELNFTWALDSNGVPVGADYAALVRDGVCNLAPVLQAVGARSVNEGETLEIQLTASDANPGDTLTYAGDFSPTPATGKLVVDATSGRATWTPTFDDAGTYTVTFTVSDGTSSDTETITLTVVNTDRPPAFERLSSRKVRETDTDTFTVEASDPDRSSVVISLDAASAPTGFTFDPATNTASWTPGYDQAGLYTVTFTATSDGLSATATVEIEVTNRNRVPVFTSANHATARAGEAFEFPLAAEDPDGETVTFGGKSMHDLAQLDPVTGLVTWTPTYDDADQEWIVEARDPSLGFGYQTLTVTLEYPDRAPTLAAVAPITVPEGAEIAFAAQGDDPDKDPLTYELSPLPEGATFDGNTGNFGWTPTRRQAGTYALVLRVLANGKSAETAVDITVTETNRPPTIDAPDTADAEPGRTSTATFTVSDPDGQDVTCTVSDLPEGATYDDATRTLSWETPWEAQVDGYVLQITCTDGEDPATDGLVWRVGERVLSREGGGLASCLCSSGGGTAGVAGLAQLGLLLFSLRRRRAAGGAL